MECKNRRCQFFAVIFSALIEPFWNTNLIQNKTTPRLAGIQQPGVIIFFIKFLSTLLHQLQNPIRCVSIAGGHEFFPEGVNLGGVEAGV